jgi:hypothetical protein
MSDLPPSAVSVYAGQPEEMLLEISAFRVGGNPYEDLSGGYYILNTNIRNDEDDHKDMLANGKAAAYFDPWKFKIERLKKGDVIFLYQSGVGIVAVGEADGKLQKRSYHENSEHKDEEYFMKLRHFEPIAPPLKAAEIKRITKIDHRFMSVMFGLDADSGKKLRQYIHDRQGLQAQSK